METELVLKRSRSPSALWKIIVACGTLVTVILVTSFCIVSVALSRVKQDNVAVVQSRSILAAMGNPGPGSAPGETRPWTIAIGHDWAAHEYINEKGYLAGFGFDLIREVCASAATRCVTIWDKYSNCMQSIAGQHSLGGNGLLGFYYDACAAWVPTVSRIQMFKFTKAYIELEDSFFFVSIGRARTFQFNNTMRIGFLDGWSSDEKCLARRGPSYELPVSNVKHYVLRKELVDAINNGDVDAGFSRVNNIGMDEFKDIIEPVNNVRIKCSLDGNAMMMRKENTFDEMFNAGLNQIMASGKFGELCADANKPPSEGGHGHRGAVKCKGI